MSAIGHGQPGLAYDLVPGDFYQGVTASTILPPVQTHCDGFVAAGAGPTVDPTENWYCFEDGAGAGLDFAQFGWDDNADRILGSTGTLALSGSAEIHPIGAMGDDDAFAGFYTLLQSPHDWEDGSCTLCTLHEDHVLLVDGWVRSEGLLTTVDLRADSCEMGGDPADPSTCSPYDLDVTLDVRENRVTDGYRDGIDGVTWQPIRFWTIVSTDTDMLRLWVTTRSRWNDLGLEPQWWVDDLRVREYTTSGVDGFKFRPWYPHNEPREHPEVAGAERYDGEPTAYVDPDRTTQVTLGVDHFTHDSAGGAVAATDYCGALQVTLPEGVMLAGLTRTENAVLLESNPSEVWLLQYASAFDTGAGTVDCDTATDPSLPGTGKGWEDVRFETLMLDLASSASCPDDDCGDIAITPYWFADGDPLVMFQPSDAVGDVFSGIGPAAEDLVVHVTLTAAGAVPFVPTRLHADLAGTDGSKGSRVWPGFLDTAADVGADSVTLAGADVAEYGAVLSPDTYPTDIATHGCTGDCSADCEDECALGSDECFLCYAARWRNMGWSQFPNLDVGAKANIDTFGAWTARWVGTDYAAHAAGQATAANPPACAAVGTDLIGDFDDEMERVANASRLGLSFVMFDQEPDSEVWCDALEDQWSSLSWSDLDGDLGADCDTLENEALYPVQDACDGRAKDLLRANGDLLWLRVRGELENAGEDFAAAHPGDVHDPTHPSIGNWRGVPGSFSLGHNGYADLDRLFPQVFSYAMPTLFPWGRDPAQTLFRSLLDPADPGLAVRRDLLSMMALGSPNLLPPSSSRLEPDLPTFDFTTRFCEEGDPETLYPGGLPDGVVVGGASDADQIWWNCLDLVGDSGQAARGYGALTLQPLGYWGCDNPNDDPVFGTDGCGCQPSGDPCNVTGYIDFLDAFLVGEGEEATTSVQQGEMYIASVAARFDTVQVNTAPSDVRPGLVLLWLDDAGEFLAFSSADHGVGEPAGQWFNLAVADYAPPGAASVSLGLFAPGVNGQAWFDDLVLAKANLVSNGRMLSKTGSIPDDFDTWEDAGHAATRTTMTAPANPTHRVSFPTTTADHAVRVARTGSSGTGIGGVSQKVSLPPKNWPTLGYAVPFQFSARFRTPTAAATPVLRVLWWHEDGGAGTPDGAYTPCPSSVCAALPASTDWKEIAWSLRAPDDAIAVTLYAGAEVTTGGTVVDDVLFRVDGPYVVPWVNSGTGRDGEYTDTEVLNAATRDTLVASFVSGAQRTGSYFPPGMDGRDVSEFGSAMAMLAGSDGTREAIVADGEPIPGSRLRVSPSSTAGKQDRVFGMEWDDQVLISVTSFGVADPSYKTLVELREHSCDLSLVEADGSLGALLGTVSPPTGTVEVTFENADPHRTQLVYGTCAPY